MEDPMHVTLTRLKSVALPQECHGSMTMDPSIPAWLQTMTAASLPAFHAAELGGPNLPLTTGRRLRVSRTSSCGHKSVWRWTSTLVAPHRLGYYSQEQGASPTRTHSNHSPCRRLDWPFAAIGQSRVQVMEIQGVPGGK
eukprot:3516879-Amphidinium_carterae.1